jgi:hypothetical protein
MSYIVLNCPSCIISPSCCAKYHIDNGHAKDCQDIEDCVIKQVIEKCKDSKLSYSKLEILRTACETNQAYGKAVMAEQILQLFDIEEIN